MNQLRFDFYNRPADTVAQEMLGKLLVRRLSDGTELRARIVETEAYLGPHDLAAHSSKGITPRTQVLYGPAGVVYIFLIYGIYKLLNFTTGPEGSAVLIRAVEPVTPLTGKTSGPGLLTKALQIGKELNATSTVLSDSEIFLAGDGLELAPESINHTARVG